MKFSKYHAIGNDYLVLVEPTIDPQLSPLEIERICDRHFGIGSDGILAWKHSNSAGDSFRIEPTSSFSRCWIGTRFESRSGSAVPDTPWRREAAAALRPQWP